MNFNYQNIPGGLPGTKKTLRIMRDVVQKYKRAPAIRLLAQGLVSSLKSKDFDGEIELIHRFVRDRIRYVMDIRGVETIQSPIQTLNLGSGDCDDVSILVSSLLESIGHKTRLVACGQVAGRCTHVYAEAATSKGWQAVECTEKWKLGRAPGGVVERIVLHN